MNPPTTTKHNQDLFAELRGLAVRGFICWIILFSCIPVQGSPPKLDPRDTIHRIAFGSCIRQEAPQPIWPAVFRSEADLFILLGDNIYADTTEMTILRTKYRILDASPGFQRLRRKVPLLATWDDHDYGADDAGVEYPRKVESQQAFLDFFLAPPEDPRRSREGVYDSCILGPSMKRVQVILLDTRYFRSPLTKRPNRQEHETRYLSNPSPESTFLGPAQWSWFREQLLKPAEIRIIVSSIQVLTEGQRGENWSNFPLEKQRLIDVVRETRANGVFFISGDCHYSELSLLNADVPYPFYDLTSSTLNQGWYDGQIKPNTRRLGQYYPGDNFGLIEIDWRRAPTIHLQIRNVLGRAVINRTIELAELKMLP